MSTPHVASTAGLTATSRRSDAVSALAREWSGAANCGLDWVMIVDMLPH
jgi:hypothetical protein